MQNPNTSTGISDWGTCTRCRLHTDRGRVALRTDSPRREHIHILFIGEAPGRTEDRLGIPFCGDSKRILFGDSGIIEQSKSFTETKYSWTVTNIVCCRPEENRQPVKAEIELCRPHIDELVTTTKPTGIVYLGLVAKKNYPQKLHKLPCLSLLHPAKILREEFKLLPVLKEARKLQLFVDSLGEKC